MINDLKILLRVTWSALCMIFGLVLFLTLQGCFYVAVSLSDYFEQLKERF